MGIFTGLLKIKYDDEQILKQAKHIIARDPIMRDLPAVHVSCQDGTVTLTGNVNSQLEKAHIEDVVRTHLKGSCLNHKCIENQLQAGEEDWEDA